MKIPLSNSHSVLISKEDAHLAEEYIWHLHATGKKKYARGYVKGHPKNLVYMHRVIMGAKTGDEVDHKDGDGLNNSRANLRIVDRTENNLNRKGVKGYYKCSTTGKFRAEIIIDHKKHRLGRFDSPDEARAAYLVAKQELLKVRNPHFELVR